MPVGEDEGVASDRADLGEHAFDARGNGLRGLPIGNAVVPEAPAGKLLSDLERLRAFVGAVIPLHELFIPQNRTLVEAPRAAGFSRPNEWARQRTSFELPRFRASSPECRGLARGRAP